YHNSLWFIHPVMVPYSSNLITTLAPNTSATRLGTEKLSWCWGASQNSAGSPKAVVLEWQKTDKCGATRMKSQ
ncbi:MAG TPA: hypothetical protein VF630_15050, partial [Hymenobacter sp.]